MLEVIDFHGHFLPPSVVERTPSVPLAGLGRVWDLLTNAEAQLERAAAAGTDVKVVNAPIASLLGAARYDRASLAARTNDALALEVQRFPDRLVALATVDAYAGEAGAEEARRAVLELGLPGIVVDAADGELLLSDPVARPTLEFAAEHGVIAFAHPVTPAGLGARFSSARQGVGVARGTESALSTLSLLAEGVFTELPDLQVVIAGIGGAALLLAPLSADDGSPSEQLLALRRNLYIDTMSFEPAVIRFAIDVLGVEHVLVGSDWPINTREPSRERVQALLTATGLDPDAIALVANGNARRLLSGSPVAS